MWDHLQLDLFFQLPHSVQLTPVLLTLTAETCTVLGQLAVGHLRKHRADPSDTWVFHCTRSAPLTPPLFKGQLYSQEACIIALGLKIANTCVQTSPSSSIWYPGAPQAKTLETKCSQGARPGSTVCPDRGAKQRREG